MHEIFPAVERKRCLCTHVECIFLHQNKSNLLPIKKRLENLYRLLKFRLVVKIKTPCTRRLSVLLDDFKLYVSESIRILVAICQL